MVIVLIVIFFCGYFLLNVLPEKKSLQQRLKMFPQNPLPLRAKAEIYWNNHQIPFIQARSDDDLPFLIGLVHAHLRLAQMEILRRLSQGRVSEMIGSKGFEVDYLVRLLNFEKAVHDMKQLLPETTRHWLERYRDGINFYRKQAKRLPVEFRSLALGDDEWTVEDILTLSRLIGADINWLFWYSLLGLRDEPAWPELWERLLRHGLSAVPTFSSAESLSLNLLSESMKSGSNCFVISGKRKGGAVSLIANDTHVGLSLPSLWLIIGYQSPSYHAVGFSIPGIPVLLIGRNESISWGGTNAMSLSSSLYDLSSNDQMPLRTRNERIKTRLWFDKTVSIRESTEGPIITDHPNLQRLNLPPLALKWRGHSPSDEITTFLKVNKASTWSEFRRAFATYAVSGQNFLYADSKGNIGQLVAADLSPASAKTAAKLFGDHRDPLQQWTTLVSSLELPSILNPSAGYLVSTNNPLSQDERLFSTFANSNDRFERISSLIEEESFPPSLNMAKKILQDVYAPSSHAIAKGFARLLREQNCGASNHSLLNRLIGIIEAWNGNYTVDSQGATLFQFLLFHFADSYYSERYGKKIANFLLSSSALYDFLEEDLRHNDAKPHICSSAKKVVNLPLDTPRWGVFHFLRLHHLLGDIPFLGYWFRFGEFPSPGSTTTVFKSAHDLSSERHFARYGANARFIADLSDLDENYFILLGGEDGWVGSKNFLDQFPLWQQGNYIKVPLRLESISSLFPYQMSFTAQVVR